MSGIRTRIADSIQAVDDWRGVTDPTILADAVIAALGLRPETGRNVVWSAGGLTDKASRYVTEWTTDV